MHRVLPFLVKLYMEEGGYMEDGGIPLGASLERQVLGGSIATSRA
jgi:hypothetical protein